MKDICKQDTDKVLLLEGKNDCHVVMALCKAHQVPETFGIYECGADTEVLKRLNALISRPNAPQVIGVMLDADSPSLEGRWASIKGKLNHYSYNLPKIPDQHGTIIKGIEDEPKLGFWLMPNNQDSDKLTTFQSLHLSKAIIHTYLAWQDEPGYPMGQAITKETLRPHTDIAINFTDWLRCLFN
jgi:hypothetical protein